MAEQIKIVEAYLNQKTKEFNHQKENRDVPFRTICGTRISK